MYSEKKIYTVEGRDSNDVLYQVFDIVADTVTEAEEAAARIGGRNSIRLSYTAQHKRHGGLRCVVYVKGVDDKKTTDELMRLRVNTVVSALTLLGDTRYQSSLDPKASIEERICDAGEALGYIRAATLLHCAFTI